MRSSEDRELHLIRIFPLSFCSSLLVLLTEKCISQRSTGQRTSCLRIIWEFIQNRDSCSPSPVWAPSVSLGRVLEAGIFRKHLPSMLDPPTSVRAPATDVLRSICAKVCLWTGEPVGLLSVGSPCSAWVTAASLLPLYKFGEFCGSVMNSCHLWLPNF